MKNMIKYPLMLAVLSLSMVGCQSEEFALKNIAKVESMPYEDIVKVCIEADSVNECNQLNQICQPAFNDSPEGSEFYACVPLPDPRIIDVDGPINNPTPGSNDPISSNPGSNDPISNNPPSNDPSPSSPSEVVVVPPIFNPNPDPSNPGAISIPTAIQIGCSNLAERFLVKKGKGQPKVLVCHNVKNNPKTISIACPALKAHLSHGHDTVGACL
jgi:hypothetical protein